MTDVPTRYLWHDLDKPKYTYMNMKYKYEICIWFQVKAIADKSKKKCLGIPKDKFGIVINWDMEGMMRSERLQRYGCHFLSKCLGDIRVPWMPTAHPSGPTAHFTFITLNHLLRFSWATTSLLCPKFILLFKHLPPHLLASSCSFVIIKVSIHLSQSQYWKPWS